MGLLLWIILIVIICASTFGCAILPLIIIFASVVAGVIIGLNKDLK